MSSVRGVLEVILITATITFHDNAAVLLFFCFVRFQSQVCQNLLSSCNPTSPYRSISSHVTYFRPINFETPGGGSYSFGADNYIRAGGAEYVGVPVQATKQGWPWLIGLPKAMCWCQTSNANVPGPGPMNMGRKWMNMGYKMP